MLRAQPFELLAGHLLLDARVPDFDQAESFDTCPDARRDGELVEQLALNLRLAPALFVLLPCRGQHAFTEVSLIHRVDQPLEVVRVGFTFQHSVDDAAKPQVAFDTFDEARLMGGILTAITEHEQLLFGLRQIAHQHTRDMGKRRRIAHAHRSDDVVPTIGTPAYGTPGAAPLIDANRTQRCSFSRGFVRRIGQTQVLRVQVGIGNSTAIG